MSDKNKIKLFGGLICSSFGKTAVHRLRVAKSLGCDVQKGGTRQKLSGTDILFLSGHHYGSAKYKKPLKFDAIDLRKQGNTPELKVKLLMVSSCSVLCEYARHKFKNKFPSAYIFGWRSGSPSNQYRLMSRFIESIDEKFSLNSEKGMEQLIQKWRAYIEKLKFDRKSRELGYATPSGIVTYYSWDKGKGEWMWKTSW